MMFVFNIKDDDYPRGLPKRHDKPFLLCSFSKGKYTAIDYYDLRIKAVKELKRLVKERDAK